eukprot:2684212-Heterocapsa_arctica.AAC.1
MDEPRRRKSAAESEKRPEGHEWEPSRLMQFLLCATAALEGADTALLPAVIKVESEAGSSTTSTSTT